MSGSAIVDLISQKQDLKHFRAKHWEGSFAEYLDVVAENPAVARNAYERVYDMVMSYGSHSYEISRSESRTHFHFFDDPDNDGADAVFGLDASLEQFVNALKSAAKGYGIEKRVLLLHGPVGSSKSTIARLLKRGLERYSARDEGALYTLGWMDEVAGEVSSGTTMSFRARGLRALARTNPTSKPGASMCASAIPSTPEASWPRTPDPPKPGSLPPNPG